MATSNTPKTAETNKPKAEKKPPVALPERIKAQLTAAALKAKVTTADLDALESHIGKLRALLS